MINIEKAQTYFHLIFPIHFGPVSFGSTPFGYSALIYQTDPFLVSRVILPRSNRKAITNIIHQHRGGRQRLHETALSVKEQIVNYFRGMPIKPPAKWLDMTCLTPLQKEVLVATSSIGYGTCCTYKDIAVAIGRPKACRFVGNTLAINPFPILIPCHRVIRSDMTAGQFEGGTDLKIKLIEHEIRTATTKTPHFFQPAPLQHD
jgi:methylated-DNA-[protein]-cysteine S-methyltransferase